MSGFKLFLMNHVWFIRLLMCFVVITVLSTTIFLHRHLSHGAVRLAPRLALCFQAFLAWLLGVNAAEWWVGHSIHHTFADRDGDPHSPWRFGFLWVLFGAVFAHKRAKLEHPELFAKLMATYQPTLVDRVVARLAIPGTGYALNSFGFLGVVSFALFGWAVGHPWQGVLLWLINAACCLLFFGLVNCLGHWSAKKNRQGNHATDLPWPLRLLLVGEGAHEAHHAHPRRAYYGWTDITGWCIRFLVWCGLGTLPTAPAKV